MAAIDLPQKYRPCLCRLSCPPRYHGKYWLLHHCISLHCMTCSMALVPVLYLAIHPCSRRRRHTRRKRYCNTPPGAIPAKVSFAKLVLRSNGRGAQLRSGTWSAVIASSKSARRVCIRDSRCPWAGKTAVPNIEHTYVKCRHGTKRSQLRVPNCIHESGLRTASRQGRVKSIMASRLSKLQVTLTIMRTKSVHVYLSIFVSVHPGSQQRCCLYMSQQKIQSTPWYPKKPTPGPVARRNRKTPSLCKKTLQKIVFLVNIWVQKLEIPCFTFLIFSSMLQKILH
jgi:hypothetical protein